MTGATGLPPEASRRAGGVSRLVQAVLDEVVSRGWPLQGKFATAMLTEMGISESTFHNWKRGTPPRIGRLLAVVDKLGLEVVVRRKSE